MGFSTMTRDLNATNFQASIGLSVYALGFGVVPLVTASFSEEFGRLPLYIGSGVGFLLMYMMVALCVSVYLFSSIYFSLHDTGQEVLIFLFLFVFQDQKIYRLLSWLDLSKARVGRQARRWWEGPSLIFGYQRSE